MFRPPRMTDCSYNTPSRNSVNATAAEDGECQYEISNTLEEYNRVARERELTRA